MSVAVAILRRYTYVDFSKNFLKKIGAERALKTPNMVTPGAWGGARNNVYCSRKVAWIVPEILFTRYFGTVRGSMVGIDGVSSARNGEALYSGPCLLAGIHEYVEGQSNREKTFFHD